MSLIKSYYLITNNKMVKYNNSLLDIYLNQCSIVHKSNLNFNFDVKNSLGIRYISGLICYNSFGCINLNYKLDTLTDDIQLDTIINFYLLSISEQSEIVPDLNIKYIDRLLLKIDNKFHFLILLFRTFPYFHTLMNNIVYKRLKLYSLLDPNFDIFVPPKSLIPEFYFDDLGLYVHNVINFYNNNTNVLNYNFVLENLQFKFTDEELNNMNELYKRMLIKDFTFERYTHLDSWVFSVLNVLTLLLKNYLNNGKTGSLEYEFIQKDFKLYEIMASNYFVKLTNTKAIDFYKYFYTVFIDEDSDYLYDDQYSDLNLKVYIELGDPMVLEEIDAVLKNLKEHFYVCDEYSIKGIFEATEKRIQNNNYKDISNSEKYKYYDKSIKPDVSKLHFSIPDLDTLLNSYFYNELTTLVNLLITNDIVDLDYIVQLKLMMYNLFFYSRNDKYIIKDFMNNFQRIINLLSSINNKYKNLVSVLLFSNEDIKLQFNTNKTEIEYVIDNDELMPSKSKLVIIS